MSKSVTLTSANQTSKILSTTLNKNVFKVSFTQIKGTLISGSMDYGAMNVKLYNGVNLLQQTDFYLTGTLTDYDYIVNSVTAVTKIEIQFSATGNIGLNKTQIDFNGQVKIYDPIYFYSTYWIGWVQPDKLVRKYFLDNYYIQLYATDGLQDLQNIDYPFDYVLTTGLTSILKLTKLALNKTDIQLPIQTQVNINSPDISGDQLLKNVYGNPLRFVGYKDGKTEFTNAFDAISYMLEPFNCILAQSEGKYKIWNKNEANSKKVDYVWSSLSGTVTTYDRTKATVSRSLFDTDELSKIRPFKRAELTFDNLNTGSYAIGINRVFDGANFPNELTDLTYDSILKRQTVEATYPNYPSAPRQEGRFIYGGECNLDAASGSTATVSFDINLASVVFTGSTAVQQSHIPYIRVSLHKSYYSNPEPDNDGNVDEDVMTDFVDLEIPTGQTKLIFVNLKYDTSGINQHYVRVWIIPRNTRYVRSTKFYFGSANNPINIFKNNDKSLTTYKLYSGEVIGSNAIDKFEKDLFFGDGNTFRDSGALLYAPSAITKTWNNYGGSEKVNLQRLHVLNKLRSYSKFKNYLRVIFFTDTIEINNLVTVLGKKYNILSYNYDVLNCYVELELSEFLENSISVAYAIETYLKDKN